MQKIQISENIDTVVAVSVVVVNYNAGELLVDCVRAVLAQACQVVVVDNASTDRSLELLESSFAGEPRLQTLLNTENLGFAAACNLGISLCRQEYILFLNPDCELLAGTLQQMVSTLEADSEAGMVGGLLLNADGSEQGGGRRAVPTPWRSFVRAVGLSRLSHRWPRLFYDFHLHKQPLPEQPIAVEAISGALMLVRRAAVDDVGLWDERYFLHCEDLDWCMRFRRQGWSILFDPAAPAIHGHGMCSKARPIFVSWHKHKGMVRFYRKFFRHQYPGALMALVIVGVWARFVIEAAVKTCRRIQNKDLTHSESVKRKPDIQKILTGRGSGHDHGALRTVAVVGATSIVGRELLALLSRDGVRVIAYSRRPQSAQQDQFGVEWREMSTLLDDTIETHAQDWIWLAPIRTLSSFLPLMARAGAKRFVAVSTTSCFTKKNSSCLAERKLVEEIIAAEDYLQTWSDENQAIWTILRPTMIYGAGRDKNVTVIARFIKFFRFFPVLGQAQGLRQPIHVKDVAAACKAALESDKSANRAYNISGAEKLSYRMMVERMFCVLSVRSRIVSIPLWLFDAAVTVLRVLPPFRLWTSAMAERMNQDMVFDHVAASNDFGFAPRQFELEESDLP